MTSANVFALFDILQDKYGAPYFPVDWQIRMFNMCQYEYLHDLLPEEGGDLVNFEFDENITTTIQPLIWTVSVNMNGAGLLPQTTLDTAIKTASGDTTATMFKIMSVGFNSGSSVFPAQYVKYNNLRSFQANIFKAPKIPTNVRYTFLGNGIQFYPTSTTSILTITVIKTPRNISDVIDPEWSDYVCYNLIVKMLKLAGVATGSEELINDVRSISVAG